MPSRAISDLDPRLQSLFHKFEDAAKAAKIDFILTCTYRSGKEQDALYAQGRTKPGKKVTNARAGQSKHNATNSRGLPAAKAFDIVVMVNGKPEWNTANPLWPKIGAIGKKVGLDWGGSWPKLKDFAHFQLNGS